MFFGDPYFFFLLLETTDGLTFDAIPKVKLLRTLPYIRKRCADVMLLAREGKLGNFRVEEEKIKEAAMIVKVRGTIGIGLSCFVLQQRVLFPLFLDPVHFVI